MTQSHKAKTCVRKDILKDLELYILDTEDIIYEALRFKHGGQQGSAAVQLRTGMLSRIPTSDPTPSAYRHPYLNKRGQRSDTAQTINNSN